MQQQPFLARTIGMRLLRAGLVRLQGGAGGLLLCVGLLACAMQLSGKHTPPQGWWSERGPVVPHDSFPADCALCHEGDGWRQIKSDFKFDHLAQTGVELKGAHASAECLRCHNDRGPVTTFAGRGCSGCHEDPHQARLGQSCETCHNENNWRPQGELAKHQATRFPLVGAHLAVACWRCHPGAESGRFTGAPTECSACHQAEYLATTSPNHLAAGFPTTCEQCHQPSSWTGAGFVHPVFPLTGSHVGIACTACHIGGNYTGLSSNCYSCHAQDYAGATDPNHSAGNFPTDCQQCHNTVAWQGALFSHAGITSGCVQCHQADYNGTTDPSHIAAGFPTNCEACHNTNSWNGAVFSHSFPIKSGAHKNFDCAQCHLNPSNYQTFSCTHCHEHNQQSMNNKHQEVGGYSWSSPACLSCHPNGKAD